MESSLIFGDVEILKFYFCQKQNLLENVFHLRFVTIIPYTMRNVVLNQKF